MSVDSVDVLMISFPCQYQMANVLEKRDRRSKVDGTNLALDDNIANRWHCRLDPGT